MSNVENKKQSSAFTIFTIWAAIVGTSVLTVPWAIAQVGYGTSFIVFVVVSAISAYTAHLIVKNSRIMTSKIRTIGLNFLF